MLGGWMIAICVAFGGCDGATGSNKAASESPAAAPRIVSLTGEAIELSKALAALGLPSDDDQTKNQVVLRTNEGALIPLLKDEASRALFLDERLRERPILIHARKRDKIPYLQVLIVRVKIEDAYREPQYYCEVCTITVRYPQICPCCQGPMILKYKPETGDPSR